MKRTVLLSAVIALALAGCTEVPEDVRSRTEEQQARESAAAEDSKAMEDLKEAIDFDPYEKVPLSVVKAELENYQFKKHDNLNFNCKASPVNADEIYNIKTRFDMETSATEEDKEHARKILKEFWGQDVPDDRFVLFDYGGVEAYEENMEYEVGEFNHDSPSFAMYDATVVPFHSVNYTYFKPENCTKEPLDMADGSKLTVDEAVKQGEEYIKRLEKLGMFDVGEGHMLYRVAIGNVEGKGKVICLHYQQTRYGIPVDDSGLLGTWHTRKVFFELKFAGDNDLHAVKNFFSNYENEKEPVKEIIPLSSAEYLATNGLAKYVHYDVSDVALRYVVLVDDPMCRKATFVYQPMWCFNLFEWETVAGNGQEFQRIELYVDAITGEIYFSDPSRGEFLNNIEMRQNSK